MQAAGCIGVPSDLSALAEMGSCGQHSNSMHRDLVALVKDDSQLPQPFFGVSPLQEAACGTSNHVAPLGFSCLVGKLQTILGNSFFCLEARMHCSAFGSILLPTFAWLASEASMNNGKLAHCHSSCMAMLCQQLAVVRFGQSFYKPIPGAACWPEEQLKREACTFGVLLSRT